MALESHIAELMRRHEDLEQRIEREFLHPGSDDLHITELKRRKLRLKDEIEKLTLAAQQAA
ncbi:YdcH family protein [Tepidicaulis sp. LMO-SS28]|uniref:YdcH family protein n=1 Tax=Tepidicaulis sp. LMO-SS28 TaxID=3447455 RepID=UPI003EE3587D